MQDGTVRVEGDLWPEWLKMISLEIEKSSVILLLTGIRESKID